MSPARIAELQRQLGVLTEQSGVVRVEILTPDGTILVSNVPGVEGQRPVSAGVASAVAGQQVDATVAETGADESEGPRLAVATVIREYLPIITGRPGRMRSSGCGAMRPRSSIPSTRVASAS